MYFQFLLSRYNYVITVKSHFLLSIAIAESTGSTKRTRSSKCSGKAPDPGPHAVELPSSNSTIIEYECHDKEEHVEVSGDKVVYCYNKKWVGEPLECRRTLNNYVC